MGHLAPPILNRCDPSILSSIYLKYRPFFGFSTASTPRFTSRKRALTGSMQPTKPPKPLGRAIMPKLASAFTVVCKRLLAPIAIKPPYNSRFHHMYTRFVAQKWCSIFLSYTKWDALSHSGFIQESPISHFAVYTHRHHRVLAHSTYPFW